MDSSLHSHHPDNSDMKPSFRRPSNDTTNRKYRHHSPISGSHSSSFDSGPKHDRNHSPYYSKEHSIKISDGQWKRKGDEKDFNRDSGRSRSGKHSDSYRHAERKSYRNPDNHRTQDDYSRHRRHADDEERGYQRSSRSGRESRSGGHYDHTRQDTEHDRYRENWRNSERYSRDRSDDRGHRKKDTERQTAVIECHRHNDNDLSSERSPSGRRQANSNTKEVKMGEQERHRDRGGVRDDKKDHRRSTGDHKNDNASNHEEFREHAESLTAGRDSSASRLKETYKSSSRESNAQKEDRMQKRKHDDQERDNSSSSPREKISRNDQYQAAEKSPSSSNDVQVTVSKLAMQPVPSSANKVESSNDLDAAKVAAMKAAELVNRNIVGSGYMSTDQKKKLLWGNKKTTAAVESGSHWGGMPLFSDRERQEKFNKLMGVKGDLKLEQKPTDKDGSSLFLAEKQEQLQEDLEKQYTAGLRRRDGRTVGLGL